MKIFVIILLISEISSVPIDDGRIIFRDDNNEDAEVVNSQQVNLQRLLDDENLLKSDNLTTEFLIDEDAKDVLENGEFYQGDIVLMEDQLDMLKATDDEFGTRTGILSQYYRWPKNRLGKVIVPYAFSNQYSLKDRAKILLGMRDIKKYTCVEFKPHSNEADYIYIYSGDGCSSNLGKVGGQQAVSLHRQGCLSRGTVIHELIHVLGYDHMHSHSDRDQYVQIIWNNINKKLYNNFEKVNPNRFSNFGTPYDYYSVMHYSPKAFSNNGQRTIEPTDTRYRNIIGQRFGLSNGDAKRINNMYNCFR
ncbi:hatching enzyme 1.2-like [Chironomus tepperi]|uniref:hatching enzyme 1.2-like n=1 Tax=Chironomus tepperi TaxID=113505 RepID=UPI00391F97B0